MLQTPTELVLDILKKQGYSPFLVNENYIGIQWIDENADECYIDEDDIDVFSGNIAWFQSSYNDNHILKIYNKGGDFKWTPITHSPIYGCHSILVRWYNDKLLFIYKEKHDIYICSICNETVKHINYYGEELMINKNLLSYTKFNDTISLLKIPELIELDNITLDKAKEMDLVPEDIRDIDYKGLKTK